MERNSDENLWGGRTPLGDSPFTFECHAGLACFTRCCRNADMYLYPYDVIRMKRRLGISSDRFLKEHVTMAFRDNPYFPSLMLNMSDRPDKACPFLTDSGCQIYEDRPFSCRFYPLERAVARADAPFGPGVVYFVARHDYCLGHGESRQWTAAEWVDNQQVETYNQMNDHWVDVDTIFRNNPWGEKGVQSPALQMAFMACFNVDRFRKFVLGSSFLQRFDLPRERVDRLMASDEELMLFGFEWVRFFLTNEGPLTPRESA